MNANGHEAKRNLFVSVRLYSRLEIPARLVNHEWTLMDTKQSETYSRLFAVGNTQPD